MIRLDRRPSRRDLLAGAGAAAFAPACFALGQAAKVKLGVMLPYTGTYAQLGEAITAGLKLAISEAGGRLGGREVEFATVDDESEPAKAPENATRLVTRDKVDFLIGTVHSGVAMAMVKIARDTGTMLVIPNAGAEAATGALCAPNIFRTSFSNWQPAFPMGKVVADRGLKTAVTLTWQYAAGEESAGGFKEGFTAAEGKVVKELRLPFPNVEFQPLLTEIAAIKPDLVYAFFAGGGAVKLVKDYAAAGLKDKTRWSGRDF
jgi:branched-chain amino acid transport system substrate-binding protein